MQRNTNTFWLAVMLSLALAGCTDQSTAERALKSAGFTNIQTGGWAPWSCSDSDQFATKFTAKNSSGQTVTGAVCSGWLKGATIRFD